MRDLSDIVLKPSEFAVLAAACKYDPLFPADYAGWSELMRLAEMQARERGMYPTTLLLVPEVFVQWCSSVGVVPCLDALRAFAILKRGKVGGPLGRFLEGDSDNDSDWNDTTNPPKRGSSRTCVRPLPAFAAKGRPAARTSALHSRQ